MCSFALRQTYDIFSRFGNNCAFSAYEDSGVSLSIDGNDDMDFKEGEIIKIRRSEQQLSIIDINGSSFYKAVHNKLMRPLK